MRHNQIAFEFFPDPELPAISGIADQIRQVVLNIFLNAIEIMKPGGCLTVQTQSLLSQKEILFSVKDTGPGINPEIMPAIFEPFITNKSTGTGLGLTITHDIIQQHHGRIEAENHVAGGAIFNVWLPIDEEGLT
jgi:signal transduction histidine kinase